MRRPSLSAADPAGGEVVDVCRPADSASGEVVDICRNLIRIDTSNVGGVDGACERPAAEYLAELLTDAGTNPSVIESAPGRANVVARIDGSDPLAPALVVNAHLDVVPANGSGWRFPPYSGEIADGCLWGRGAVDMKHMAAMAAAAVRSIRRRGLVPRRDIVLAIVADEEVAGEYGAGHLVTRHRDLFEGCTEALGEVGGFSQTMPDGSRIYPVQTGQKGVVWLRLRAEGRGGHASLIHPDNAVFRLAGALAALADAARPVRLTPVMRAFLHAAAERVPVRLDPGDPSPVLDALGPLARFVEPSLRTVVNATILRAGDKENTVPTVAEAVVDVRTLPGEGGAVVDELRRVAADFDVSVVVDSSDDGIAPGEGSSLMSSIEAVVRRHDPAGHAVPYLTPAATDAYWFAQLGITSHGFTPLRLPDGFDLPSMFHGVDERVPVDALRTGARMVEDLLLTA